MAEAMIGTQNRFSVLLHVVVLALLFEGGHVWGAPVRQTVVDVEDARVISASATPSNMLQSIGNSFPDGAIPTWLVAQRETCFSAIRSSESTSEAVDLVVIEGFCAVDAPPGMDYGFIALGNPSDCPSNGLTGLHFHCMSRMGWFFTELVLLEMEADPMNSVFLGETIIEFFVAVRRDNSWAFCYVPEITQDAASIDDKYSLSATRILHQAYLFNLLVAVVHADESVQASFFGYLGDAAEENVAWQRARELARIAAYPVFSREGFLAIAVGAYVFRWWLVAGFITFLLSTACVMMAWRRFQKSTKKVGGRRGSDLNYRF